MNIDVKRRDVRMTDRSWKIYYTLAIVAALVLFIINGSWAAGWILGCTLSRILYWRIERFWGGVIDSGYSTPHIGYSTFGMNLLIMAGGLLVCIILPNVFNIFAYTAGILIIKFTSLIDALSARKES